LTVPLPRDSGHLYRFPSTGGRLTLPIRSHSVRFVGDCNRYDDRTPGEVGLRAAVEERDGVRTLLLGARDHSACISLPVPYRQGLPFLLRFVYRSVTGAPARVCVWEDVPGRCATLPPLDIGPGWHRLQTIVSPPPAGGRLRLFLYADGGGDVTTQTEYRAISIQRPQPLEAVAIAPLERLPAVWYRRLSPSEFRIHVVNAHRPFLLVVSETYAPGWHVRAIGQPSLRIDHLRVNGYANGWRLPWRGTYDLMVSYAPEDGTRLARRVDLVLIPLTLLGWLGWRIRARTRGPLVGPGHGRP
jgi:arabinofuranan 3-O-arabinosyltransferase